MDLKADCTINFLDHLNYSYDEHSMMITVKIIPDSDIADLYCFEALKEKVKQTFADSVREAVDATYMDRGKIFHEAWDADQKRQQDFKKDKIDQIKVLYAIVKKWAQNNFDNKWSNNDISPIRLFYYIFVTGMYFKVAYNNSTKYMTLNVTNLNQNDLNMLKLIEAFVERFEHPHFSLLDVQQFMQNYVVPWARGDDVVITKLST